MRTLMTAESSPTPRKTKVRSETDFEQQTDPLRHKNSLRSVRNYVYLVQDTVNQVVQVYLRSKGRQTVLRIGCKCNLQSKFSETFDKRFRRIFDVGRKKDIGYVYD